MKYATFLGFGLVMFFTLIYQTSAVSLIEAPVVNGVVNSAWQYQGARNGIDWYMKGQYLSNPDGTIQFASLAEFTDYMNSLTNPNNTTITSDIPIGPGGGLNPGWQFVTNGWYFKNPTYSNENGTLQFGSLADLNAYLAAKEAEKVLTILPPTTGCTGYENNSACRPEWADALSSCIPGTVNTNNNETNGQCSAYINSTPTLIQTCTAFYTTGACRPERVNPYAAAGIARKAEAVAKVKGYTAVCNSGLTTFPGIDPNTGLQYFYTPSCTINGKTGIGAEWMINGSAYWWSALNEYLTGKTGTITATSIPTTSNNTGNTLPGTFTISSSESAYVQNLISVVNNIILKYKNILAGLNSGTLTPVIGQNTTPIQIPNLPTVTSGQGSFTSIPFRYLKFENVFPVEWAAWRELEFYDANGIKLSPIVVGGSSDWNPQTPKDPKWAGGVSSAEIAVGNNAGGKMAAIDGNLYTQWNSAAQYWVPNFSAPTNIILDFGKSVTLSRMRFSTQGENARNVNIWIGDSPTSQTALLKNITGSFTDMFWIDLSSI